MSSTEKSLITIDEIVPLKNRLLKDKRVSEIYSTLVEWVQSLPNYKQYKMDIELLKNICKKVENLVKKSDGINKRDLVVDIFAYVFELSDLEKSFIVNNIEFLLSNKDIKKIKSIKKGWIYATNYIKKTLL